MAAEPAGTTADREVLVMARCFERERRGSSAARIAAGVKILGVAMALHAQVPSAPSAGSHWPGWPPADIKRGEPAARGPAAALALEAAEMAVATCSTNGFKVAALVVDSAGEPVAMAKADGAPPIDLASATRKDFVVIYTKLPSADAASRVRTDESFAKELAATGKALPVRGGLPIKVGDVIIGAIAVGGAPPPGDQDELCARAGLDKIVSRLK